MIKDKIYETRFDFISERDKQFIIKMTEELEKLGYSYGDAITDGICWGKYMLIFRKSGVKSKKVYARIYIKDTSVALRLFLSNVTEHSDYIMATPDYIRNVFLGDSGKCKHCRGDECKFKKAYCLGGELIEKCNGEVFTFYDATVEKIPDYVALFCEFFKKEKKKS